MEFDLEIMKQVCRRLIAASEGFKQLVTALQPTAEEATVINAEITKLMAYKAVVVPSEPIKDDSSPVVAPV